MMAASSWDWNVFKQIFADHWEGVSQVLISSPVEDV
jgi:hypothetical protein